MTGKKLIPAVVLLGFFWGGADLAAQSKKGMDAYLAGDCEQAIAIFKAEVARCKEKDLLSNYQLLGFAYLQNKQYPEAIGAFNNALKHKEKANVLGVGSAYSCYGGLGQAYLENKQYQEAIASFSNAADYCLNMGRANSSLADPAPWERLAGTYYGQAGRAHLLEKSYPQAVDAYKKALELDPTNGLNYSGLALVHVELKEYDEALAAARRGAELAVNFPAASFGSLGDVHAARKEYDLAIDAYRKAVEAAFLQPAEYKKMAGMSPSQKLSGRLLEAWNIATVGFYVKTGQMFMAKGDYAGAVDAIDKAAELAPKDAGTFYQIGLLHFRMGKFDEAVASFDKAIGMVTVVGIGVQISMENGPPVLQRQVEGEPGLIDGPAKEAGLKAGDTLIKIGGQPTKGWDIDKTIQNLRGAENAPVVLTVQRQGEAKPFERTIVRKRIIPKAAAAYFGSRGLLFREKGDRDKAAEDAGQAYSLDPEAENVREAMAAVNIDGGKYEAAIQLLSSVKDNPLARVLEATAYVKQKDFGRAGAAYLAIPEDGLMMSSALAQNALGSLKQAFKGHVQERLEKAGASEALGRFLEAMAEYAEAVKVADEATSASIRQRVGALLKANPYLAELPEDARKRAMGGDVLVKDGRFDRALNEYQAALGLAPFNPQLHFNTALICGQLKDYRRAIEHMTIYLQLYPDAPNARAAKDEIYKWEFLLEEEGKK